MAAACDHACSSGFFGLQERLLALEREDSSRARPERKDAPAGQVVCTIFCVLLALFLGAGLALSEAGLFIQPYEQPSTCRVLWESVHNATLEKRAHNPQFLDLAFNLGATIGVHQQAVMQACISVMIGFLAMLMSVVVSALSVTFNPGDMPNDFEKKGTLSNVSQDVAKPRGRMFAICLFTASMLMLLSHYTLWIYPAWLPNFEFSDTGNPMGDVLFELSNEKAWRTAWNTVPYVGLMFTAAIPSLSDTQGYNFFLMLVHNIVAPLSMGFALIMETVQVSYGERLFSYFFSDEPRFTFDVPDAAAGSSAPCELWYYGGSLSFFDRWRAVLVIYAWMALILFLAVQIYLYLPDLGIEVKHSYRIALLSFYAEITVLILAFGLPFAKGVSVGWRTATPSR